MSTYGRTGPRTPAPAHVFAVGGVVSCPGGGRAA